MSHDESAIWTVTLNPAIDRSIEAPGLAPGAHLPVRTLQRSPGGKGVNVSRVLAGFGVPNTAMGFLGEDNCFEFDSLFGGDVLRAGFVTVPGRTRENLTLIDPAAGTDMHLRDAGFTVRSAEVRELAEQIGACVQGTDWVVFAGSLPGGMGADSFGLLLDAAGDTGARLIVDASGEALVGLGRRSCWLIKPNAAELAELVGRDLPDVSSRLKAARGLAQRVENVLLSDGANGAWLITRQNAWHARVALDRPAVNTVGCGDTLLAGFLAALYGHEDPDAALRTGVLAAAATALSPTPGEIDPQDMARLESRCELTEVGD